MVCRRFIKCWIFWKSFRIPPFLFLIFYNQLGHPDVETDILANMTGWELKKLFSHELFRLWLRVYVSIRIYHTSVCKSESSSLNHFLHRIPNKQMTISERKRLELISTLLTLISRYYFGYDNRLTLGYTVWCNQMGKVFEKMSSWTAST